MTNLRQWIRRTSLRVAAQLLRRWIDNPDCRTICRQYGFHPTPLNYMYPIPDVEALPPSVVCARHDASALRLEGSTHLAWLRQLHSRFGHECRFPEQPSWNPNDFHLAQDKFTKADASILHMMIRETRPRRIVEVGCGNSTLVTARAGLLNSKEGAPMTFTAIEPCPKAYLQAGVPGLTRLVAEPVERVSAEVFKELEANDILFIDSSHIVKCGSDLQHLLLNVVPNLCAGVVVHFHDIYLPYEYPSTWLQTGLYYNESYFLHAFLSGNRDFETVLPCHWLERNHPEALREMFGEPRGPSSYWVRKLN